MAKKMAWRTRLWVIGGAVAVGVIVLTAEHNNNNSGAVGGSQPSELSCTMRVTETVNVRSGPGTDNPVVETLASGTEVAADRVTRNEYRQLGTNRWAAQQYLIPTPGSDCG